MTSTISRLAILSAVSLATLAALFALASTSAPPEPAQPLDVRLGRTITLRLPQTKGDLRPESFKTPDGKTGWVVQLPNREPIATPAYTGGKLLVSGGFASNEVYALDAKTGAKRWIRHTIDNGPTAVVTEGDYAAYSTESCDLEVVDTKNGNLIWHQMLAGSLLTQPAISEGKLFVAYPGGSAQPPIPAPPPAPDDAAPQTLPDGRPANGAHLNTPYRLLCADLKTGRKLWEQDLPTDVITAPIIDDGQVYLTCMDGTTCCIAGSMGCMTWQQKLPGTSAPTIGGGHVLTTQKRIINGKIEEGLVRLDPWVGEADDKEPIGLRPTRHFELANVAPDKPVDPSDRAARVIEESARANLNLVNARDAWTYQGPRAVFTAGAFINANDNLLNSVDAATGKLRWQALVSGPALDSGGESFLAPAVGKANLYLLSPDGYVVSLNPKDAQVVLSYKLTGVPFCWQPCLADGNIYAGTTDGRLICIPADKDADGWYCWGGNAAHNKGN